MAPPTPLSGRCLASGPEPRPVTVGVVVAEGGNAAGASGFGAPVHHVPVGPGEGPTSPEGGRTTHLTPQAGSRFQCTPLSTRGLDPVPAVSTSLNPDPRPDLTTTLPDRRGPSVGVRRRPLSCRQPEALHVYASGVTTAGSGLRPRRVTRPIQVQTGVEHDRGEEVSGESGMRGSLVSVLSRSSVSPSDPAGVSSRDSSPSSPCPGSSDRPLPRRGSEHTTPFGQSVTSDKVPSTRSLRRTPFRPGSTEIVPERPSKKDRGPDQVSERACGRSVTRSGHPSVGTPSSRRCNQVTSVSPTCPELSLDIGSTPDGDILFRTHPRPLS